jgi:raffinose/stachyose/melibiose transport system permease protein
MGLARYSRRTLARELVLILVALVYCLPFYLLVALSLETTAQAYRSPMAFPWPPQFGNFAQAWNEAGQGGLQEGLVSSLVITVSSVAGVIVLGSLCAYAIARRGGRLGGIVYVSFVVGIILPFQLALLPLYVAMRHLGLVGNYVGMIVLNIGLALPLAVFLYTGFIRALPRDYEEAALVDGAGILRTYARVVFPLLLPVTATVAVLVGISVWNDFFVSLIFLIGSRHETLPVALYVFEGEDASRWNLIFAGVVITIAPMLAFYLFAQRKLIHGFTAGVKG